MIPENSWISRINTIFNPLVDSQKRGGGGEFDAK